MRSLSVVADGPSVGSGGTWRRGLISLIAHVRSIRTSQQTGITAAI
jgi:hypothetical protein